MSDLKGKWSGRVLLIGMLLFGLALALRILFLLAIPDVEGPLSPFYKGDTPTWLGYARAIQSAQPFDLGIPLRPPGIAYLVALLWNGQESGLFALKLTWAFLGAGVIALFFVAVLRSFGLRVAVIAAFIASASTGLMILSTSINNEIPYLLLVMASFTVWEPIRHRPRLRSLLVWSGLNGLACLIRVEHVLFFSLTSAYLLWNWSRLPGRDKPIRQTLGHALSMLILFALPLVPWQLHIFSQIDRFNREPLPTNAATEQLFTQLERELAGLRWSDEAVLERDTLPMFCRRPLSNFVATTVAIRGGAEVNGQDFRIIEEAFGARPEPLGRYPFVALYGGLNFYLANNAQATGGFTRAPLEAPPPLTGGPSRYPGFLLAGLPPPEMALSYPPHVEIVNHGYRYGLDWILSHPSGYLSLAWNKIRIFWAGLTMGMGGYNLPLGLSGVRRLVDMVVPEGGAAFALWRWAGLVALLLGLWAGRRNEALVPWLLLLTTKVITTLTFFGYAREGAVLIPVFALLLALGVEKALSRLKTGGKFLPFIAVLAAALIAIEAYRWHSDPAVTLDGRDVSEGDPFPGTEYEERHLQVR